MKIESNRMIIVRIKKAAVFISRTYNEESRFRGKRYREQKNVASMCKRMSELYVGGMAKDRSKSYKDSDLWRAKIAEVLKAHEI